MAAALRDFGAVRHPGSRFPQPYAKVLVKTKTTPRGATFDLLYLNHHNIPTIENLVADTQDILKQLRIPTC